NQADAATVVTAHADLPAPVEHFVGRGNELTTIINASQDTKTPHVFCIEGMPGSGKTELAIMAARRLLDESDIGGVLHTDLRGYHPDNPPGDPAAVLDTFLRLLGASPREIPTGLAQRQA
ncbi:zeta toxin family protein, partial [Phytoactinopolyspora endophytica]|uniref:zeta toxin family protein n=1 Tax=Phytoactinopolyspora endophytica TaxID=1642495 RepID=UPI0013EAD636